MTLIESEVSVKPDPGVYPDVPAAIYHGWDAASSHRLSMLDRSPLHMLDAIKSPRIQTPAMSFGEAVHTQILEPMKFKEKYAIAPECDRRTTKGKEQWNAFLEQSVGKLTLSKDDADSCMVMYVRIMEHPAAWSLLAGLDPADVELSAVWDCRTTGVRCKMRTDLVRRDLRVAVDLKTCEDASRSSFERSIFNFKYYRQAAHYMRGLAANGIEVDSFVFIAVEKSSPYGVAVYRLDDEVLAMGDEEVIRLLEQYGRCEREKFWPSYPDEVQNIRVPQWALSRMAVA